MGRGQGGFDFLGSRDDDDDDVVPGVRKRRISLQNERRADSAGGITEGHTELCILPEWPKGRFKRGRKRLLQRGMRDRKTAVLSSSSMDQVVICTTVSPMEVWMLITLR